MRYAFALIATFVFSVLSVQQTSAQSPYPADYGSGYGGNTIRCESHNGRTQYCDTQGGGARLVRQLSKSPCIQGQSWGTDSRGIWVSQGCRAEFEIGYGYDDRYGGSPGYGQTIRCESHEGRMKYCDTYGRPARLVRQLSKSPCIQGQTWGTDSRGIWVSRGCRAEFSLESGYDGGYGQTIRCESHQGRYQHCPTQGGYARLARQLSQRPCIEGRSWGNDARGVWVSDGCRAEFRMDHDRGYGNGEIVRCESQEGRSRECRIPSGRGYTVRLVRQLSSSPCIEGSTWGHSRDHIWVTRGCRAEFMVGHRSR